MVRKFGLSLAYSFLTTALFLFALMLSVHLTLDNPATVEQALSKSGIYNIAATSTFEQQTGGSEGGIPTSQPAIQAAITQAFPPSMVEQNTNRFITSMFAWIHGSTATPQFSIDLTQAKTNLADNIGTYVQQHLSGLPVCTLDQMPTTVDIYTATCVPPNFDVAAAVAQAKQQTNSSGFLSNPVLTSTTLPTNNGQSFTQNFEMIPKLYHWALILLYVLPIIIIGLAAAVIFLSATRRMGIRRVSVTFVTTGITSVVLACVGVFVLQRAIDALTKQGSATQPIQVKILRIVELLGQDLRTWWVAIGAIFIVAGIMSLIVLRITRPKAEPGKLLSPYESLAHPNTMPTTPVQPENQDQTKTTDNVGRSL
jgi:hypothetical protein